MALPAQAAPTAPAVATRPVTVSRNATVVAAVTKTVAAVNATTVRNVSAATIAKRAFNRTGLSADAQASSVLSMASSLSGIYYRWGGTTPSGFDCSGFTSYIYAKAGVRLPRTAAAQQRFATRVSDPQPGDLIFFGYPAHHVGIYAGNGKLYHSPRSGKKSGLYPIYSRNVSYGRVLG